jgi:xanthine permease XanP
VREPANLTYGVNTMPPWQVSTSGALQAIGINAPSLLLVVLVATESRLPVEEVTSVLGTTMLALAAATAFQLFRGRFGSGFPIIASPTSIFLLPALLAAREGGPALVASMTVISGVLEGLLSRLIATMRPLFAPEIAGLILCLSALVLGADSLFELIGPGVAGASQTIIGLGTLALLIGLAVWGGRLRMLSPLIGLSGGYIAAAAWGLDPDADAKIATSPWFGLPHVGAAGFGFSWGPVPIYLVATLALVLKQMADISTFQKLTDADWVRPDLATLEGGILANGTANVLAGLMGTITVAPASSSVGVVAATGIASRMIGVAGSGIYLLLAFMPKVAALLVETPKGVLAASLLYAASFILVNGLQIVTSRLLDTRRALMIGITLFTGVLSISHRLPVDFLPERERVLADSPLVPSTLIAMLLNIVFRIGIRRLRRIQVSLQPLELAAVEDFLDRCGAEWGARPAMITRVKFAAAQTLETLSDFARSPVLLRASFDEFTLRAEIVYDGELVPLPESRPDQRAIIEDPNATRLLAGWMLRRNADRVQVESNGQRQTLTFVFDH